MLFFTIKNLSSFLSAAEFVINSDGSPIYHIEETIPSPFKRLVSLTKFRMLLSLELDMIDLESNRSFRIIKKVSYPYNSYTLKGEDGHTIASFEPKKRGWKWLPISSLSTYIVKNGNGEITGSAFLKNPTILGSQHSDVSDMTGQTIATFEWKKFSLWKGYRECELLISRYEEDWVLISIVAAIIKGLYLQQR